MDANMIAVAMLVLGPVVFWMYLDEWREQRATEKREGKQ